MVKISRDVPWKFIPRHKQVDNILISVDNYREKIAKFKKFEINHKNPIMIKMCKFSTINIFKDIQTILDEYVYLL